MCPPFLVFSVFLVSYVSVSLFLSFTFSRFLCVLFFLLRLLVPVWPFFLLRCFLICLLFLGFSSSQLLLFLVFSLSPVLLFSLSLCLFVSLSRFLSVSCVSCASRVSLSPCVNYPFSPSLILLPFLLCILFLRFSYVSSFFSCSLVLVFSCSLFSEFVSCFPRFFFL